MECLNGFWKTPIIKSYIIPQNSPLLPPKPVTMVLLISLVLLVPCADLLLFQHYKITEDLNRITLLRIYSCKYYFFGTIVVNIILYNTIVVDI